MEILIAEDERPIAESLKKNFLAEGHHVMIVEDGAATINSVSMIQYDVILLDWKMPVFTGLEVCKKLRAMDNCTPIILLTALNDISNKVEALNAGADDYITKPFSFAELMARINAVLRRFQATTTILPFGDYSLNLINHTVETQTGQIKLSEKEFELLRFFVLNKGIIISRDSICEKVWGLKSSPMTNVVEVTVKNLRKKLESNTNKKFIKTIYGEGYIFFAD